MSATQNFRTDFTRSLFMAAVVFAVAHAFQTLAMSSASQHAVLTDRAETVALIASAFIEGAIFIAVGWPAAYLPVFLMSGFLAKLRRNRLVAYMISGFLLGLMFLPVCASVPDFVVRSPDDRTYLATCVEYAYPMTFAGVIGGYAFWRFTRRMAEYAELVADQFS
jgi:hypothetical protein